MNKEETKQEKRVREISEQANPYDKTCPNRHLWSEGFRTGYIHAKNIVTNLLREDLDAEKEVAINVDTKTCKVCGGRTALVTGEFYYDPDAEPYQNGIKEEAKVQSGECWVGGYKCDDCGSIQDLWHE